MKRNENNKKFLAESILDLIAHRSSVNLHRTKKINLSPEFTGLGGYFLEKPKEISVACGGPFYKWFPIYLHEYNHFRQSEEQCESWTIVAKNESLIKLDNLFNNSKEYKQCTINQFCKEVQNLELDCELRTIETINKYNLEVDIDKYIQGANAYVSVYTLIKTTKKWPNICSPYSVKEIVDSMPKTMLDSYDILDPLYIKLAMEHCYSK